MSYRLEPTPVCTVVADSQLVDTKLVSRNIYCQIESLYAPALQSDLGHRAAFGAVSTTNEHPHAGGQLLPCTLRVGMTLGRGRRQISARVTDESWQIWRGGPWGAGAVVNVDGVVGRGGR